VPVQGYTLPLPLRYTVATQNIHLICLSVNESPSEYLLNYKWATLRLICYTTVPLPMTDNFIRILLKPLVVFERLMHHAIMQQDRQSAYYNVTLRPVHPKTVTVEKQ